MLRSRPAGWGPPTNPMSIVANRPIEGMRAWAAGAFRWWIDELRAACADLARWLRDRRGNTITIEAGERQWRMRRGRQPARDIDAAGLGSLAGAEGDRITVQIPPERVLSKSIELPAGAQAQLDRILPFEMSRHFPFAAERVFYGYRVVSRPAPSGAPGTAPLEVEIAAVPREIVFAIADALTAAGLQADAFALIPGPGAEPLFLAPHPMLPIAAQVAPRRDLLIAALALTVLAVISWPVAQHVRLAGIERDIAALKPAAETALRARTEFQREADQAGAIARLRTIRPPLVAVLDRISRDLPDGAWLLSLSLAGRDLVLDGLAPSAATIALALQHGPQFTGIVFRSPISRDAATGLEHFQLGATVAEAAK